MDFAKMIEYMRSAEFKERFEAAVAADDRDFGDCAEEVADETREALDGVAFRPLDEELSSATAVLNEIRASGRHQALCTELDEVSRFLSGSLQVYAATIATATALLLAKTAMPGEEAKFPAEVHRKFAPVRALPVLVELASCLIDGELASRDSIRDQAIIDDALFSRRIRAIRQVIDGIDVRQL
ncbi:MULTISPECIES: hypothetical protein [unclassified Caballeronia]|uniref:hypothetical protein n=1 Tax=unclassified Caballeronia TaxID=2646786 RepID=UPI002029A1CE|nr:MULTISPECIES: hypothetical protein [unclassified Caballeronia]